MYFHSQKTKKGDKTHTKPRLFLRMFVTTKSYFDLDAIWNGYNLSSEISHRLLFFIIHFIIRHQRFSSSTHRHEPLDAAQ